VPIASGFYRGNLALPASSPVRSAFRASAALPVVGPVTAGIQALIGDIDRFAKEWTEMFDELSARRVGAEDPEVRLSRFDASIRIRPTGQPENPGPFQADNPAAAAGKGILRELQTGPSGSTASVSTEHLASINSGRYQCGDGPLRRDTGEPSALAVQGQIFSQGYS
jgi:hypothetical protein